MVYTLFSLMFKVFFVAAAAYLLRRRGALTEQDQKSVTNVLMRFVVYFTVIMSSQQDFSLEAAKAILVTAIYAVLFFAVFFGVHLSQPPAEAGGGEAEGFCLLPGVLQHHLHRLSDFTGAVWEYWPAVRHCVQHDL